MAATAGGGSGDLVYCVAGALWRQRPLSELRQRRGLYGSRG